MYKLTQTDLGVCAADGFYADGISGGLKPDGAKDIAFIYSDSICEAAFVFTTNKMQAAPIVYAKQNNITQTNFVLINSKNANAMTGKKGLEDIQEILNSLPFATTNPLMSSTGVIGVRLPKEKIKNAIVNFDITKKEPKNAAEAIMTTDTFPKMISFKVTLEDGSSFNIGAMAKGAGMINPAMATMLCFITTDAKVSNQELQAHLNELTPITFNAISVDGDTSTNDTVMILANGKSGVYHKEAFKEALHTIMLELAKMMVKDGEGATKLVTYQITGAANNKEAEIVAKALSDSLLVKTALYGEDPNWGRIASTVGASGVEAYEDKLTISFDDVCVYKQGEIYFDEAMEAKAAQVMKKDSFCIQCDLGIADGSFTAYGCDLGYEYVKINADYRT